MKLSIIIISYNTIDLTLQCLESVYSSSFTDFETILVDNASTDDTPKKVKAKFPQVKIIKNKQNLGFTRANNQGIKKSRGEHILLLNSDTIVKKDSLQNLVDFMDSKSQVGIATAHLLNQDGSIQPAGGHLPNLANIKAWVFFLDDIPLVKQLFPAYHLDSTLHYQKTRPFGWVPGTAMIIRRKLLDQIGLLDENIFMYAEDIDLCIRAHQAGHQVYHLKSAPIVHLGHKSGTKESAILGEIRGLIYLYQKHRAPWQQALLKLTLKLGLLFRQFIFATIARNKTKYEIYQKAYRLV